MLLSSNQKPQITNACISITMITLNEEGAIAKVVGDIRKLYRDAQIVVVDSSTDRTAEIATNLGCKVIKQYPPKGYGPAMHQALTSADKDYIITMDCDDTYPVEAIEQLMAKLNQGYDLVSASRLKKRPENMPLPNYIANYVFALCARIICHVNSTDVHTGMRAYKKSLLERFPYQPNGLALPVELQVGPASVGFHCTEIFIDYRPRIGQSKLERFASTVWTMKRIWRWRCFLNKERESLIKQLACNKQGSVA